MAQFIAWCEQRGVEHIDLWRGDLNTLNPVDGTEPWVYSLLAKFVQGKDVKEGVNAAAAEGVHAAKVTTKTDDDEQQLLDDDNGGGDDRGRGSFEIFGLGSAALCDTEGSASYHCIRGFDAHSQSGPPTSTVVTFPEPVRSGQHSLRSGPFNYTEGYRVEVIPANNSEPSEEYVIEGFGVPVWYGFSVFLPSNYSADEISSPDRIFQWHGDSKDEHGNAYRCNLNPVLTFEALGPYMTLVQKIESTGYHSPPPPPPGHAENTGTGTGSRAVPLFEGEGSPCGPDPPPGSCTAQDGRCAAGATLDQFLHGWYSNTSCTVLGDLSLWRNGWTDVVVRVVWNYNDSQVPPLPSDGQLDVWINGSKRFSRGGANCFNDYGAPFAKFGIYKYPWKTKPSPSSPHGARVGPVQSRLAWHDEVYECRGDNSDHVCGYEAVEAQPVLHKRVDGPVPVLPQCAT